MPTPNRTKSPSRAAFRNLRGVWRSHGYGILLDIGPTTYRLYEETKVSCLFIVEGPVEELDEFYVEVEVSAGGRAFRARRAAGVTRVSFRRLNALPRACRTAPAPGQRKDPEVNFDVLWHTFAERYALFEHRGVDWDTAYAACRPRVDADTSAKDLFRIVVEMLRPLRDGHVEVRAPCGRFQGGQRLPLKGRAAELEGADVPAFLAELHEALRTILRERYLRGPLRRAGHGLIEWGRLDEATGYLAIRAMAGQSGRLHHPRADQEAAAAAMDRVLRDLGDLPALVVDLRENGGGYDGVALRIAGTLTDRKRLAFHKAPRAGDRYAGRQPVYVVPQGDRRYGGRILVLTSALTASAAEIFLLALLRHPRITRVGEPTHGILSDAMERHLPNGWTLTLSNELYQASDGALYEDVGVPPHLEIPFLHRRGIDADRDPILDASLRMSRGSATDG